MPNLPDIGVAQQLFNHTQVITAPKGMILTKKFTPNQIFW
jgi:hypothetical protein